MIKLACTSLAVALCIASLSIGWSEEQPVASRRATSSTEVDAPSSVSCSSLEEARRQAELLHAAMHSTLQAVHHQYYRPDEGLPIPAAILKEVFADLENDQQVKLRWLAVDGQAMNSDHKPRNSFEIEAVRILKSGKREHESVEDGVYRRAGRITLTNQCLKCHVPDRKSTDDRTAGLIIAIPLKMK